MSANLATTIDGRVALAYAEDDGLPWHGTGQPVKKTASIGEWAQAGGLNFDVKRAVVECSIPVGSAGVKARVKVPAHDVLYRGDSGKPIAVVSSTYQIHQPQAILGLFGEWFDVAGVRMVSCGLLGDSRILWAQAEINGGETVLGEDALKCNIMVATGLVGNMATTCRDVDTRIICNNTFTAAMGEDNKYSLRVTHRSAFDPARIRKAIEAADSGFRARVETYRALAKVRMNMVVAEELVQKVLRPVGNVKADGTEMRKPSGYDAILSLFQGEAMGAGFGSSEGTAWGLFNAFTQHVDHGSKAKSSDSRTTSAWFGDGAALKQRALQVIRASVGV